MAIIIDTNCFSHVFNGSDKRHQDFVPVLDWIIKGQGFIVYGGSKYIQELKKCRKYHKVFNLLKDLKKVLYLKEKDRYIDKKMEELYDKYGNEDFDDPHLPAIALATKCKLICSVDTRSMPYVKSSKMYPKGYTPPQYYTGKKEKHLLNDNNIDQRLLEYRKTLNKTQKEAIEKVIETFDDQKYI